MNELDAAYAVRDGALPSPTKFENITLFAMRVTSTGAAYRSGADEFVWRDPSLYLNDTFIARVSGLPIIWEHPEKGTLDSKEFAKRIIGVAMFGYIKDEDVWCVARIYDDQAIATMVDGQLSTSPTVVFENPAEDNTRVTSKDGKTLLIEGDPALLCHLAVVAHGVWDKQGAPNGIQNDSLKNKESTMPEEEMAAADAKRKADAEAEEKAKADKRRADAEEEAKKKADADEDRWKKFDKFCDSMMTRMDAFEAKAKADAEACEEEKKKADKAKADAEAEEAKKKEEAREKADADLRKTVADLQTDFKTRLPREFSPEDRKIMADAQARCDAVAMVFGDKAPPPMAGEMPLNYRQRLLTKYLDHSPDWKNVDLAALPEAAFTIAEARVYADAMAVGSSPATAPEGTLREIRETDETGRIIKRYVGKMDAWLGQFKMPKRYARLNLNHNRGA